MLVYGIVLKLKLNIFFLFYKLKLGENDVKRITHNFRQHQWISKAKCKMTQIYGIIKAKDEQRLKKIKNTRTIAKTIQTKLKKY